MLFVPVSNGTLADHAAVPEAVPEPPTELRHVTVVVSADVVPLIMIAAAKVATMVEPGEMIFKTGGALTGGVGFAGGGGGAVGLPAAWDSWQAAG